jgi:CheY-like chemotaxis protein
MPVENGFTAAEQIKKDEQLTNIPLLMLTSYSSKGSGTGIPRSRGMSLEAEDYINKPVSPRDLLGIVAKHLKKIGL